LLSFQLTAGLAKETGLDGFPLERVAEIHIAGGLVASRGERTVYFDAHAEPVREELFELLALVLPRCTTLRAVTYEADGHTDEVAAANLARLRALIPKQTRDTISFDFQEREPVAAPSEDAWRLAREAHTGEGPDFQAAALEAEYRLAIIAQQIDPTAPDLLAPRLAEFARAPELLEGFRIGRPLRESFALWAMRRCFARFAR
jgi:hypothetical protein